MGFFLITSTLTYYVISFIFPYLYHLKLSRIFFNQTPVFQAITTSKLYHLNMIVKSTPPISNKKHLLCTFTTSVVIIIIISSSSAIFIPTVIMPRWSEQASVCRLFQIVISLVSHSASLHAAGTAFFCCCFFFFFFFFLINSTSFLSEMRYTQSPTCSPISYLPPFFFCFISISFIYSVLSRSLVLIQNKPNLKKK